MFVHLLQIINYVLSSPFVVLLTYWFWSNKVISPFQDETSFWNIFEVFLGYLNPSSKLFRILAYMLPKLGKYNIPFLDEISIRNFKGILFMFLKQFHIIKKCCMSVSLLVCFLQHWNQANIGISLVLDHISFWNL